jgi:hypothetical protein
MLMNTVPHLLSLKPYKYGIFDVLMVVTMKVTVFRDVIPFGLMFTNVWQ